MDWIVLYFWYGYCTMLTESGFTVALLTTANSFEVVVREAFQAYRGKADPVASVDHAYIDPQLREGSQTISGRSNDGKE